jgi:sulfide:quinone oxidoreductase
VNKATLETATSNVFAIGDVNVVPSGDFAIPKAGVFAASQGTKVGKVIASRVNETDAPEAYDGIGFCFMAYSAGTSATVGGEFLAKGGPQTVLSEPSVSGMKSKDRFERDWRNFKI